MKRFKRILIANRGEIALRIIRACKELDLETVVVHSKADAESLPVKFAHQAVCIGPPESTESYLNIPNILTTAVITDADAIHPGYGFLAENSEFVEACEEVGITFIGPRREILEKMGNKVEARKIMKKAGLPVLQGTEEPLKNIQEAKEIADFIGLPVILKASAGGGGRGMRIIHSIEVLESEFRAAQTEAQAAFGDGSIYLEKYLESPRHIEVQILADNHGNVVHLGERECSIQRRHQKIIEEAPSTALDKDLRKKICSKAVKAVKSIGYNNVGTMEFLLDEEQNFYFMEMNTRVQVEHGVSELASSKDIIKEQILLSMGEQLRYSQNDIHMNGHTIECRINAEDAEKNFQPSPGKITGYYAPNGPGVRIDSHIFEGYVVPSYYDSLLSKLIVHAENRKDAIAKMRWALEEYVIEGIKTNIPFLQRIIDDERFTAGDISTKFVATMDI